MRQYKPKQCERCGKDFFGVGASRRDWVTRRFCSRSCSDITRRGVEKTSRTKKCQVCSSEMTKLYAESWKRWNKKKFCSRPCVSKGANYKAPSTAFKKGDKPWNFKEEGFGYQAVHAWLRRHYSKVGYCEECKKSSKTQWANISGEYKRSIKDYRELCRSCHATEDAKNPKKPKMTQGL